MTKRKRWWSWYNAPVIIAAVTLFGLMAALLGAGGWHVVAWVCLSIPLVTILRSLI
jgi:hypothetical protein